MIPNFKKYRMQYTADRRQNLTKFEYLKSLQTFQILAFILLSLLIYKFYIPQY